MGPSAHRLLWEFCAKCLGVGQPLCDWALPYNSSSSLVARADGSTLELSPSWDALWDAFHANLPPAGSRYGFTGFPWCFRARGKTARTIHMWILCSCGWQFGQAAKFSYCFLTPMLDH